MNRREKAVRILQGLKPISEAWTQAFLSIAETLENASAEIRCFSEAWIEFAAALEDEP